MSKSILWIKWALRSWPVLIFIFVLIPAHIAAVTCIPAAAQDINKVIALALQLIGVLVVVYSIDSNLGVIKGKRLRVHLVAYLREPLQFGKAVSLQAHASLQGSTLSGAGLTVYKAPVTLDEKLAYLQKQITDLKSDLTTQSANLHQKITDVQNDLDGKIRETSSTIRNLQKKVDEVTVGGIKLQLFGVLLLIHGAIAGYFA